MPRDRNNKKPASVFDGLKNRVNNSLRSLYTTTYYTTPHSQQGLDDLRAKINANLDRIVDTNMDTMGIPSVSKLYSRMKFDMDQAIGVRNKQGDVSSLFDNALNYDDFFAAFQNNHYLLEMDAEIDSTCKYFPDLEEALAVLKEGVLSPDYFSKDFLTLNSSSVQDKEIFEERVKDLKKKYNLLTFVDEVYYRTSKYGEDFIYVVPYATALSRLLTNKPLTTANMANIEHEGANQYGQTEKLNETFMLSVDNSRCIISGVSGKQCFEEKSPKVLSEGTSFAKTERQADLNAKPMRESATAPFQNLLGENESFHLQVEICRKGIIESAVQDAQLVQNRKSFMESTASQFNREVITEIQGGKSGKGKLKVVKKSKTTGKLSIAGMEDELGVPDDKKETLAPDGMIGIASLGANTMPEVKVDVPGCVVSHIRREQVIPIYIGENNTCLGYYYIELRSYDALEDFRGLNYIMSDSLTSIRGSNSGMNAPFNCVDPSRQEELLKYIAGQLSTFIDKEFINANQDLREEIYMILKYNDIFNTPAIEKVKITFVPPEDMIHTYFQLDPVTHRGISDLDKAMVPAKIYASMYISDAIGKLVRGQDKRVYYVKQQVDTNISQTLLNVINQVKQGNFGFRQFSNINNVLNITGKFNDLFIPVNSSGDAPLQIETIQGQQFTDNSEQMQQLKEMAVNTVVPFEIIQSRLSVDYAMQLSMSNSKFLRKIYSRQGQTTPFLGRLMTKLYNFEYDENLEITVTLPPPVFINTANTNQIVDNTKQFVQNIAEIDMANEDNDKVKNEYQKQLFDFYVGTHLDLSRHQKLLEAAQRQVTTNTVPENNNDDGY